MGINIDKYLIKNDYSIEKSLKSIVQSGSKCVIVTDNNKNLLGTLSDGDLRRAILNGKKLTNKIYNIFNKKPKILKEDQYDTKSAQKIFLQFLVDIIPIVDKKNKVLKVIKFDDVFENQNLKNKNILFNNFQLIIMAGGLGTRMEPFTSILPKPLIPINGTPIIELIMDKFVNFGIKKFIISINNKNKILRAFFKENKINKNLKIKFIEEKKPLGTIGSLGLLKHQLNENFFVTNCDIIVSCDYNDIFEFHKKNKNSITIVASIKKYIIPYGDCKVSKNGILKKINEKPEINLLANTGMYLMNKNVLKHIPKNEKYDLTNFIKKLLSKKIKIGVFPISEESWIDVGEWNEYKKSISKLEGN